VRVVSSETSASRDAIFEAGLSLLATEGIEALTVRRIAQAAGCSTIGVYTWFGGKDGLVNAIFRAGFDSFADTLEAVRPSRGPLGRARAQAKAYRHWAKANPMYYQVMFLKAMSGFVPDDESIIAAARSYDALLSAVNEAQSKGEITSSDVHGVAMTMWSAIHGLVSLELVGSQPDTLDRGAHLADRTFRIMLDALVVGLTHQKRTTRTSSIPKKTQ
jgi:AcrR family transcriptional regulator